jgi:hypothetical protein
LKNIIIFCVFFLASNGVVYCGPINRIELNDGSVINGEILSYENGRYSVSTSALGEITLDALKVSKIESADYRFSDTQIDLTGQSGSLSQLQLNTYKDKLLSNPENAAIITGLAADPQIQELAKDPQIMDAAKSGDIQALMKNEKFMNIVNSSKIQEAIKNLQQ